MSLLKLYKKLLEEESNDFSGENLQPTPPAVEGNDSLDSQIDRYLSDYEAEAINAVHEGQNFRYLTQRLLREKDKEKDKKQVDTKNMPPAMPSKKSIGDIDVRSYADSIARLITNINNLIETKNTILRRAINTLNKSYDPMVVRQLEIMLEDEHGLAIDKSEKDIADNIHVPSAANAGPIGS